MKMTNAKVWTALSASVLIAAAVVAAAADQTTTAARPEKNYAGTVVSVNPAEHALDVRGFIFNKKFNLGDNCTYVLPGKPEGTIGDLRPGEKVTVNYQDASGVLVADRVQQEPMRYEGTVTAIDPEKHTMMVHFRVFDKAFQIPDDCAIVLRGEKSGALADIQTGDHVTVTYETPNDTLTARQIAQTSAIFTGTLTAIDLGERTVKAKALLDTKKFSLADNCAIVINGKADGQLSDLRPDENLVFSYHEVKGINIVNRIAPAEALKHSNSVVVNGPGFGY